MRFYSADDYLFFVEILKRLSDNLISETAECPFLQPGICPGCFKKRGGRHSQSFRVLLGDQNGNVQETESFQQRFCMTQSLFAVLYGGKKTFLFVDGKGNGDALIFVGEDKASYRWSFDELSAMVSRLQQAFRARGIGAGLLRDCGARLKAGMTLAVEPMIAMGGWQVTEDGDGWTIRTLDRLPCAHYEHTIALNAEGPPEILTLPGFVWEEGA